MPDDVAEILFTEEQIRSRVQDLAKQITSDYQDRSLVLVSILRGSVFFATDLARLIDLPLIGFSFNLELWRGREA
jgi:hypoxanthine phosphoribosyltransferase